MLADDAHPVSRRKTLSFSPFLPYASYLTNSVCRTNSCADGLVRDISSGSYKIRKDSYSDQVTGVTHVYACEYVFEWN